MLDDNSIRELWRNRDTHHSAYMKQLCRDKGGIMVSLTGISDYSASPPIWRPHGGHGDFSNAIIIDDAL